jgi:hypothetical protein
MSSQIEGEQRERERVERDGGSEIYVLERCRRMICGIYMTRYVPPFTYRASEIAYGT